MLTGEGPVATVLQGQALPDGINDFAALEQLGSLTYEPGKWKAKDVLQHLIDVERILSYRALSISRNDKTPLPGFEETAYADYANAGKRTVADLLEELVSVRQSTIQLFRSFDHIALARVGYGGGLPVSVLALGYVIAGHLQHHLTCLRDRYFPLLGESRLVISTDSRYLNEFSRLNREWIEKDFELEEDDIYVLGEPKKAILEKGGHVMFALYGEIVVGTIALQLECPSEIMAIKMAVAENHRGKGIGELLIKCAIYQARKTNARRLYLYSNTIYNAPAIRLYRRLGFKEVPLKDNRYKRANIKMQIDLS